MSTPRPSQIPRGFRFSATACGLKKTGGLDLALIASDTPASAAAVFTTNLVQAAPVVLSREHVRRAARRMRAIIVNSGNANCCTSRAGMNASRKTAVRLGRKLGCAPEEIVVCSTGVIGVPMKVEKILGALPALAAALKTRGESFDAVTHAIMTTDTRPKWAAAACRIGGKTVRFLGCAKGAGKPGQKGIAARHEDLGQGGQRIDPPDLARFFVPPAIAEVLGQGLQCRRHNHAALDHGRDDGAGMGRLRGPPVPPGFPGPKGLGGRVQGDGQQLAQAGHKLEGRR
ncbi:MAG: bifunctional ornithine acetyltransferase/N-acetylglutamate synthase [Acidobacteria bacterium]|nr:bifunctional ornithine acetyltransferase/N-acetylglutamate synthase [Acidobacteriota bacterium]